MPAPDEKLERLLDEAEDALAADEPDRALAASEAALERAPRSVDALHYRAAALTYLGRTEEAHEAWRAALAVAPDDLEVLRGAADLLVRDLSEENEPLEDALDLCEHGLKLARRQAASESRQELLASFHLFSGMARCRLGHAAAALAALDEAARLAPDDPEVDLERGIALFNLLRLDEARRAFETVLAKDPEEAWAHHYLGTIAERRGEAEQARTHFRQARRLAPKDFPKPVELSAEEFDRAVKDALEALPARVRRYLTNVSISVEELPADEDLVGGLEPLPPDILGLFDGPALTDRRTDDPWGHFPSAITLFQKNLQRACRSREELIEQIGVTLVHEVGHFLGLSEEDLYERGLD